MSIPAGDNGQFYSNGAMVVKKVFSNANYRVPYWKQDFGLLHPEDDTKPNYSGTGNALYNGYLGYQPTFQGDLLDYNATFGFKSEKNGWKQDASVTFGGNQQLYTVDGTVNQSLGAGSPIAFKPGGFRVYQCYWQL